MWSSWLTFFFFLISQWLHVCLTNISPQLWCVCTTFKICSWNVPDNGGWRLSCYQIPIRLVCSFQLNKFHFNTMSVALLAISSFGTLILLSFNNDPPVKFLIVITLVVQEINFVLQE